MNKIYCILLFLFVGFTAAAQVPAISNGATVSTKGKAAESVTNTTAEPRIIRNGNMYLYDTAHSSQTAINHYNFNSIVSISPNPNSGMFTINIPEIHSKILIEIFNDLGKSVYSSTINNPTTEIDLSKRGKGIYTVFLTDENKNVVSRKLVVQ